MSNSHSDIDVDDVLSSVRRLVADDPDGGRASKQEQAADRLVLTPSLRIAEPPVAAPEPEPEPEPEDEPEAVVEDEPALSAELRSLEAEAEEVMGTSEASLRAISLEDRIAELEAAVNAQRDEFEPDGTEDLSQHVPEAALRAVPLDDEAPMAEDAPEELDTEVEPEPVAFVEPEPEPEPEWEPEPVPEVAYPPEPEPEEPTPSLAVGPSAGLSFRHRDFVERVVSRPIEEPEPEPEPVMETALEPEPVEETALEDAILDEEALRELVGQLVRQELQGELGERITRNVRKLVRREIQIALAARTLDRD